MAATNHRRAVIVGATSGIGLAVAQELMRRGWLVGIAGRRQQLLIELQRKNLNVVATEVIDITKDDAADKLRTLIGKTGGMDLYFHSSGVGWQNPSLDAERELLTAQTNVVGFTRMVNAAWHWFEEHPSQPGHIAVISSIAGTKGLGAAPSYSATKRYINHYMECLEQLRRMKKMQQLSLTDIRPGFVRTALLSDGGNYPLQLDPADVAREIVDGIEKRKQVITINWQYRILVFFWRLIPRWLWVRLKIASKAV